MGQSIYHAVVYGALVDNWKAKADSAKRWQAVGDFAVARRDLAARDVCYSFRITTDG